VEEEVNMDGVIIAEGLGKSYGDQAAVRDLSFAVPQGTVLGLLGPNGAGKTTTIDMLTTLLPIEHGRASVVGFDVATQPYLVRQVVGLAAQSAAVDEKLTARENLRLFGRLYRMSSARAKARADELIERFAMTDFADRPAETYSGGERRRLDVVSSLIADPPALFLDEPTTGLDPYSRAELWQAIRELADDGAAIVLTTQYLEEADSLADEIVIIDDGSVVASGSASKLKDDLERDVLEILLDSDADAASAAALVGSDVEWSSRNGRTVLALPVSDGARSSLDTLRRLDSAGIELVDFQLRRPTLDDVFLALTRTGAATSEEMN
jgi:ABC-2 type transport system ATP-binding protein